MQKGPIDHNQFYSEPTQEHLIIHNQAAYEQKYNPFQAQAGAHIPVQNYNNHLDQPLNPETLLLANHTMAHQYPNFQHGNDYLPKNKEVSNDLTTQQKITPIMPSNQAPAPHGHHEEQIENVETFTFSNKSVRLGFIKKVYLILSTQLLITFLVVLASFLSDPFRDFLTRTSWLLIVAAVLTFVIIIVLGCFPSVSRNVPINYILLFVFTLGEAYIVAYVCSRSDPATVLLAAGLTLGITIALTLYATFTKSDFTFLGGFLFVCLIALLIGGIAAYFFRNKWLNLVLAVFGAIIFGIYIIFDTQLIIGNKGLKFKIDDYVFAAINLYMDIIMLFLYILRIVGGAKN